MIIDDFHAIHTVQDPKASTTSKAVHMATEIVDIHGNIPCIPVPADVKMLHQTVHVGNKECRGGINIEEVQQLLQKHLIQYFNSHFQSTLPPQFLEFDLKNAQQCIEHLR